MAAEYRGHNIGRRRFVQGAGLVLAAPGLTLLGGCRALWPQAQSPAHVYRLGYLGSLQFPPALREGLRELGYVEAQNLFVEYRDDGGRADRLADLAAELVALQVDLIVTPSSLQVTAARAATSTIPIVNLGGGADLMDVGLVESLGRPAGNVTGLTSAGTRLYGKRLQLLKDVDPPVARVAVLHDGNMRVATAGATMPASVFEQPARELGIQLLRLEPRGPEELDGAFETAVRERADALVVNATPLSVGQRERVVALAAQHRLPAVYESTLFVNQGGLMAYLGSAAAMQRRAAYYVDRILKGAKPADLPVELPTTFDFVINLRTAQALGLTIPQHVLLQATEVIQ